MEKDECIKFEVALKSKQKIDAKVEQMKIGLMTLKEYIKLFQSVFNTYIRLRDKDLGCISCERLNVEEFHAGHYIATTYQYHRFNEDNVHKQCSQCNTHFRGNLIEYRKRLITKIGLCKVEYLENTKHMMLELTIPEIKELIVQYRNKIKLLK